MKDWIVLYFIINQGDSFCHLPLPNVDLDSLANTNLEVKVDPDFKLDSQIKSVNQAFFC